MRPHEQNPVAIYASTPPWAQKVSGGSIWCSATLDAFLAEPERVRDPLWLPCVGARLACLSGGPLALASDGPRKARLEAARIPCVAEDADLDAARRSFWPALETLTRLAVGAGSAAPALVLVGERDPYDRLPFFAKSGVWLFRALRILGWDELTVYATNALDFRKHTRTTDLRELHQVFAPYQPVWLSVGTLAHDGLQAANIHHFSGPHPAQHRRFKFNDGPEGYAVLLKEAGLPAGPWVGRDLPAATGSEPKLLVHYNLPESVAYRAGDVKRPQAAFAQSLRTVDPRVLEHVRRLFVLGEARSVREAARQVAPGGPRQLWGAISVAARQGNWLGERAQHLSQVREVAKRAAVDAEAKAVVSARRMAWDGTNKALAKFVRQLEDDTAPPVRAQDVKAIGDFALSLSDRGDSIADATREALGQLPLDQLARKLLETTQTVFGEETAPATQPQQAQQAQPEKEKTQ